MLAAIRRVLADILRRIKGGLTATKARSISNVVKQINTLLEAASAAQEQATRASNANSGKPQYSLTDEQASAIIETMKANAEVAPQVELTPENWMAEIEAERKSIIKTAKANGTWLKAPNGQPTNLSPKQWVEVRTKRFKAWFGDWELAELAEYLMSDDVVAILNGEEFVKDGTPLTKKVSEFYEDNYNGKVERKGLGEVILDKRSVKDSTIHGFGKAKTAAFAAVPNIITEGRVIDEQRNWKGRNYDSVTIAAPIKIGGSNYVGIVIVLKGQGTNSNRFYLHEVVLQENLQDESFKTDNKADSHRGDIAKVMQKIFISKTNSSKIVDANGEPKVVYHQTNATEYVNVETGERWDDLDWMKRAEWDERDDWDEYWQEREFYTFSRANARTTQELDGFFFAPEYDEYHEYGDRTISAFLNIKNPASRTDYNIDSSKNNAGREERLRLQQEGYDGVIREEDGVIWEYVAFEPNQIKSADPVTYDDNGNVIPLSERFNPAKEDIRYSLGQPIFYSNAEYAVRGIKQEKATPEQWLKMIEKSGGLKAGEDKWLGLSDWLKASDKKTLTKDEVLQYIAENDIQIEEVEYGDVEDSVRFKELYIEYNALYYEYGRNSERAFEVMLDNYGDDFGIAFEAAGDELWVRDSEAAEVFVDINSVNDTRLQYTTDGLTNKREIALVVPTIEPWKTSDNIHFGDAGEGRAVAWIRFGETTDAEDNRVLVIDEIQSKRHQDGREKGYISVEEKATIDAIRAKKEELSKKRRDWDYRTGEAWRQFQAGDITEQEYNRLWDTQFDAEKKQLDEIERGINSEVNVYDSFTKIPSAPFEKNWAELAMKRMLRYAAENGFDKVAWTTGDQQGERYDITKTISKIEKESKNRTECYVDLFESETGGVISFTVDKSSGEIIEQHRGSGFEGKNLSDVLGKSLAHEILSSRKRVFEQDNLRIGSEGMRAFYDQMLPSFVRKYAKKWGATVGEVTMPDLEENNTMHSVDVTPAMRESVMQGQPKFSLIGELGAANLDKAEEATKRLDNLAVARDMETAGKDAKTIKLATGWERGADGKWRYEIDDAVINQNAIFNHRDDGVSITFLGNLLTGGELLKAYPQLDDMVVVYQELPLGTLGGYSPANKLGMPANIVLSDMFLSRRENPEWRAEVERMEQEPIIKAWSDAMTADPYDNNAYESAEQAFKASPLWEEYNNLLMGKGKYPRLITDIGGREALLHEVQHAIQDIEGFAMGGNTKSEDYNRLAGEVEARNVEKRANMTTQERLASLAEETEDVAREDQIILREGAKMAMGAKKKSAEETASPNNSDHPAAISSADGAKILKNIDNLARKYQEKSNRPDTFIGDVADALGIDMPNKSSKYGTRDYMFTSVSNQRNGI